MHLVVQAITTIVVFVLPAFLAAEFSTEIFNQSLLHVFSQKPPERKYPSLSHKYYKMIKANPNRRISVLRVGRMKKAPINISLFKAGKIPEENCTPAAIYEFPSDGLTREQRKSGWISIHVLLTCYLCIVLSLICDDYFVPGIQTLIERLQIPEDVAGASFMAMTSASPELFINFVATFITEGDIGVGTVVGSNVFNILAAPACCGLFARMAFQFDRWSIIRDGLIYGISAIMLIITLNDDKVFWYEALAFVLLYLIYMAVMYFDETIRCCFYKGKPPISETLAHELEELNNKENLITSIETCKGLTNDVIPDVKNDSLLGKNAPKTKTNNTHVMQHPVETIWQIIIWPIMFALKYTMPDCKKNPRLYPFTLFMCMCWIGTTSYLLSWLITAIGDTISIPDSVMGLTFLAVGTSIPEIVSCIIVSKQGHGVMGMSSALGANTFEVLLCLGLPWLIKASFFPKVPGNYSIDINSSGLAYNVTCLLSTLVFLYICLFFNRLRLDWKIGLTCLLMYGAFLVIATLIELNFFFEVNQPTCS